MNCKIPFTKDIDFEKKLYEITSISLEHELTTTEDALKGNFIISGDYKSHEVSVNKEPFSYILPFEIALTPEIDKDTIEFMIEDFTYEIIEEAKLRVKIDFSVIASRREIEEVEEPVVFQDAENLLEPIEILEDDRNEVSGKLHEESVKENKEEISEDTIIDNINTLDNNYATYHIHVVSDGESIETICTMYNSSMNVLADYNDLTNLTPGDKIIIPEANE